MNKTFYTLIMKRILDITLSLFSLIVLSPFFFVIIFFQVIFIGFPIFFTQVRVGRDEKLFKIIKFRTMNNKIDNDGKLLSDSKRKTLFGSILRASSIDELPSLINVLKGDMSIIGPRPLLEEYLKLYNKDQKMRHIVRPGLSGLAQIKGRNLLTWTKKFDYDLIYLKKITFLNDVKIIFLTLINLFLFKPVDSNKFITMEKFNGKN
jgi:lipopolysaccharide/colanic/teichoic acid biosynthesis glycosyltransferase